MNPARLVPYSLAAIGLGAASSALQMHLWADGGPAAGLFPFLAALLLIATSLLSTRQALPDAEPVELPRLLAYGVSLVVFCLMLEMIGFALAAFLFLATVLAFIEQMPRRRATLLAAALAFVAWGLFEVLLSVPLPHGIWRL